MIVHRVVGALIVRRGALLLGLRAPTRRLYPNVWDVFGGHIEPGETAEQTLVRELREELGITPTRWRYLETLAEANAVDDEAMECQFYQVLEWAGVPRNRQPLEHTAIRWLPLEQAVRLELAHPDYPAIFARALADG